MALGDAGILGRNMEALGKRKWWDIGKAADERYAAAQQAYANDLKSSKKTDENTDSRAIPGYTQPGQQQGQQQQFVSTPGGGKLSAIEQSIANRGGRTPNDSAISSQEYKDLAKQLTNQYNQDFSQADARAQSEVGRRGLIGQTGTSDIEFAARSGATSPITQAYQNNRASLGYDAATGDINRRYGTSERLSEGNLQRGWQSGENQAQRGWQTGERQGAQTWQGKMSGYINPNTGEWTSFGGKDASGNSVYGYGAAGQSSFARERQAQVDADLWRKQNPSSGSKSFIGQISPIISGIGQGLGMAGGAWAGNKIGGMFGKAKAQDAYKGMGPFKPE